MFVYLVNIKEGVHWDWECGAPAPFFILCIIGLYVIDRYVR